MSTSLCTGGSTAGSKRSPAGSVVLLPSLAEGFGNVLVEAAAAGLRSVVLHGVQVRLTRSFPGITGELVTGESAEQYASAVLAVPDEPLNHVEAWLRRFSFQNSGATLRAELLKLIHPVSDARKA